MPNRNKARLRSSSWVLRQDQLDALALLVEQRPGASLSGVLRDIVDLGLPLYAQQQHMLRAMQPPVPVP